MPSAKLNPSRINQARLAGISTELPAAPAAGDWPTEVLLFTQMPVAEARGWLSDAAGAMVEGTAPGHRLVLTEHPATIGEAPAVAPGMLHGWLALHLGHWPGSAGAAAEAMAALVQRVLKDFGIEAARAGEGDLADRLRVGDGRVVAGFELEPDGAGALPIVLGRLWIHTNTDPAWLAGQGLDDAAPMTRLGMPVHQQDRVRAAVLEHYEAVFGSRAIVPQRTGVRLAKPPWLRVKLPISVHTRPVHDVIKERGLHTVCESARCPNQGECWGHGTATFMINGDVCTRSCSFCAIFTGRPKPLDPDEPRRVGEAARVMGLRYAVVTAVNRDELPDGGAGQFAATIAELRAAVPGIRVEVLIPDFRGAEAALGAVFAARPDVLNHNVETVPRLYDRVRPQANYEQTLRVLAAAKRAGLVAKSGFMLGLGEEEAEVEALLRDLRGAGVDIVTIGQYLRPSEYHHPVVRYATPAEFAHWRRFGMEELGFQTVQSGPLVRSSYHAHESFGEAAGA